MVALGRWPSHGGVALAALAGMAVLPFLNPFHRYPLASFHSEWLAAFFGLLALMFFLRRGNWDYVVLPQVAWVPLALIALAVLQMVVLPLPRSEFSWIFIAYLAYALAMTVLGASLARANGLERLADWLAWALLIGALLAALFGIVQGFKLATPFSAWVPDSGGGGAFGALAQANHQANYLACGLGAYLYLWMVRGRWLGWVLMPVAALLLIALALTASRSVFLYLGAFVALGALLSRREPRPGRWLGLALSAGALGLFVFLQPAMPGLREALSMQEAAGGGGALALPSERLFATAGYTVRLRVWQEAILMGWSAPWIGVGIGQFSWHHFLLAKSLPAHPASPMLFNHAHNIALQLFAELGAGAVLVLVGGTLRFLVNVWQRPWSPALWFFLAILAIQGLHSLLEYPLWYTFFLGLTALALGAADGTTYRPPILVTMGRRAAVVLLVGGVAVFGNISSSYTEVEGIANDIQAGRLTEQDLPRIVESLELVRQGSLMAPYVDAMYANAIAVTTDRIQRDELAVNGRAVAFWPQAHLVARQVQMLALAGRDADAVNLLLHAIAAYPGFLAGFNQLVAAVPLERLGRVGSLLQVHRQVGSLVASPAIPATRGDGKR